MMMTMTEPHPPPTAAVVTPVVLFFLAVGLVFVGNAFLLCAGGFRNTNTGDEDDDHDELGVQEKCNSRIPTAPGSKGMKKSLASKYHTLLWPATRRSLSISPSCGSLSKRLRARSGSFTGSITALGQQQQQAVGNIAQQHFPMASSSVPSWKLACLDWMKHDPNSTTKEVVSGWLRNGDEQTATKLLLGKRLSFGTSGLRGKMGAGFGRMNDLVVIQTTQGLCRYLENEGGEKFKQRGVVIGRDHRAQVGVSSEGFARLAAAVFVSRGFKVYFLGGTVPTPLVAFGVSHLKACAGVMVTASHNPKMDNGYKVYWGNGSQIIPPHDKGIAASIKNNLEPWQTYNVVAALSSPKCSDPVDTLAKAYYQGIRDKLCRRPDANARSGLQVAYSAMHGVGDEWAQRAFEAFSLPPLLSVASQRLPDPQFPTVEYPNPEEQGALKEAIRMAEEKGVSLVLANDPDADRLAAAERQPSGEWHVFSGNEIGVLLGVWQWEEWRRTHPNEDPSKAVNSPLSYLITRQGVDICWLSIMLNSGITLETRVSICKPPVMIASTVSSKMLSAVAKLEGFHFEETLPGFKWMGHRAQELKARGCTILFAFEEAIGFGPGDVVFEKDGLSSAAVFCEMVVALREQAAAQAAGEPSSSKPTTGLSLLRRRLDALHERYGEFTEDNGYVRCEDTEVVSAIFRRLRGNGTYRSSIGGYRVTAVRDLAAGHGYDSEQPGGKPALPVGGAGTHFLTFKLGDEGVVATLRTSGTEPKIKYYLEMQGQPGVPLEEVSRRLSVVADVFVEECLQPKRWGLQRFSWA